MNFSPFESMGMTSLEEGFAGTPLDPTQAAPPSNAQAMMPPPQVQSNQQQAPNFQAPQQPNYQAPNYQSTPLQDLPQPTEGFQNPPIGLLTKQIVNSGAQVVDSVENAIKKKEAAIASNQNKQADVRLDAALFANRSLLFYTLTATVPLVVIIGALLFTNMGNTFLMVLSMLGAITSAVGMGRLLHDLTLDIAGYPDFQLPIWSIFYLIIYILSFFAFVFFAVHLNAPDRNFSGFSILNPRSAFLDAGYMSLCYYIGMSPDSSIGLKTQYARFLSVIQGILSMFVNAVIITKFVNAF